MFDNIPQALLQLQLFIVFRKFHYRVMHRRLYLEKYEISKDLEISVKACGAIRRYPIEIQVRSRIRIQPAAADR